MNKPSPVTTSIYSFCRVFINITPNHINTLIDYDYCAVAQMSYFLLKGPRKTWEGPLIAFVFCLFLFSFLNYEYIVVVVLVAQLSPTFCNAMAGSCQAPLSMGFSRWEYWSGLPFPPPGDLPNPGTEPGSPALLADFLLSEIQGRPGNFENPKQGYI